MELLWLAAQIIKQGVATIICFRNFNCWECNWPAVVVVMNNKPIFKKSVLENDTPMNAQMWEIGAQIPRGFHQDYAYELQWSNKFALAGIKKYDAGDHYIIVHRVLKFKIFSKKKPLIFFDGKYKN